jgi:hypothetical protein
MAAKSIPLDLQLAFSSKTHCGSSLNRAKMGVVWNKIGVVINFLRALCAQSHLQPPQPSTSSYAYVTAQG